MKLTIIGSAGSYPHARSAASCYLVEQDGFSMLLDLGSGALGPLHTYADPLAVDAILLSHLHADHFLDMAPMYVLRRYHPDGIPPRIPVYGPADTAVRLAQAYGMDPGEDMADVFDVHAYPDTEFEVGPFTVRASRVFHPVTAYATRIAAGGSVLAFSGDSAPCDALVDIAADADVALFEASYRACDVNPAGLHMTAQESGELARQAGASRLVLTHIVDWHDNSALLDEARSFGGEVLVAEPGMIIEF